MSRDGMQREDVERLLEPGAHDILKLPEKISTAPKVIVDCAAKDVLIEVDGVSVPIKEKYLILLARQILKADAILRECDGK